MKLFVKVIRGNGCLVEVTEQTTILEIKQKIEVELKVPVAQQTLVYLGKTLLDDNVVSFYNKIQDGAKIHLVIKKPESLNVVLERFLRKFYNDEQSRQILDEFMTDFYQKVKSLSLDDLEHIATNYLNEDPPK
ncbi:ubiquitin-like protein 4A [Atheta coriaria]|uniref:ubiquitin-like protein 4A n=1 Tax=Dalotia coriaria TaxID=877792 RepID=UPI0031F42BCC